jgi:hypothetical protein
MQHRRRLTGNQAATMVQSHVPPRHEPMFETERILTMDFTSTQAWAKEVAPPASHEGGQTEVVVTKPLSASSPLTADKVDKMYCQLVEIHAITAAQLAECAHWCWSDPFLVRLGTGSADKGPS